jgi:hypothetical protein
MVISELEEKVLEIRLKIRKFKIKYEKELEPTEKDKAVFVFDKDNPHLLRKND